MAVTREKKEQILADLKEKFKQAKGVVFAQYKGLSVNSAQEMRRGLRASNVGYKVAKKTLVRLAAKDQGLEIPKETMPGPIGVAFGFDDEIVAAQKMSEFAKKFEGVTLMGGILEGKVVDAALVKQLASIPSRNELIAKFMGSLMAPVQGFVGILHNLPGSFVRVVNAYQEKKAKETPVAAAVEVTAKEEAAPIEASAEAPAKAPEADEAPVGAPKEEAAPEKPAEPEAPASPETPES